jgi:hypothetical protein
MSKLKLNMMAAAAATIAAVMSSSAGAQTLAGRSMAACDTVAKLRESTMVDSARMARLNASCGRTRLASSAVRIPISKGETVMRVDTIVRVDTITRVDTVTGATVHDTVVVRRVDTVEVQAAAGEVAAPLVVRRYSNGFYIGIGGGAAMPTGGIRDAYNSGYNVSVPIGWDSQTGPFGLRLDLTYDQFNARSSFRNTTPSAVALTTVNPQIWSAMGDVKLRLPFSGQFAGATTGFYAIGGVGAHYLRNYGQTFAVTNPGTNITDEGTVNASLSGEHGSLWRFGANAGGGLSLGFGKTELFVEGRYVRVFTAHDRTNYVPVVVGLSFR